MKKPKRERQREFLELYPKYGYSILGACRAMDPPLDRKQFYRWKNEKWFREEFAVLEAEQDDVVKHILWTEFIVPKDKKGNRKKPNLTALFYWLNMRGKDVGFDPERSVKQEDLKRRAKEKSRRIVRNKVKMKEGT